ncbi:MAG TPA: CoA pyrophosphatase [Candidatus Omnitrophota bacterium]|nr:CoA pyrophosphatase [Candidatus Omnitrophota bacterium]
MLARAPKPAHRGDAALEALLAGEPAPGTNLLDHEPRPAAVLVPLVERDHGLTVLLTQRTAHLAHHPGQISFPGGRLEDCDQGDAVACALRETEEEIGLSRGFVTIVGRLDQYVTGTGFSVTPVVGLVSPPFELTLDAFEVADVFEVPLDFLVDTGNHRLHRREVAGRARPFWAMTWEERLIWGATAGILVNLSEVLSNP